MAKSRAQKVDDPPREQFSVDAATPKLSRLERLKQREATAAENYTEGQHEAEVLLTGTLGSGTLHPAAQRKAALQSPIEQDADRLWDWTRLPNGDVDKFFHVTPKTSREVYAIIGNLLDAEQRGMAMLRSLYVDEQHVGFGMLLPIARDVRTAMMHIYLEPGSRGQLPNLIGWLVTQVELLVPGLHLAVASTTPGLEELHRTLLAPLGFTAHTLYLR